MDRQGVGVRRSRCSGAVLVLAVVGAALGGCSDDQASDGTARRDEEARPAVPFVGAGVTSDAGSYTVEWVADDLDAVTVYATADPAGGDRDRKVGEGGAAGSVTVDDLPPAARWYFELVPDAGEPLVVADRSLHLASAPNLRDIGGYRTEDGQWVRMGLIFRSDGLDELSDADKAVLDELGIALVCDLRTEGERTDAPDILPAGAETVSLDVLADGEDIAAQVTDVILSGDPAAQQELLGDGRGEQLMVEGGRAIVTLASAREAYGRMFERFAEPESHPALFHCTAGKDRTGWGAAVVLSLLGVPRETVMDDYLVSNDYLASDNVATLDAAGALIDPALLEPVLGVAPEYLESSFEAVEDEYGSIEAYATEGLGLDDATLDALRGQLLTGG